ncbi:GNAT family N-acetyltransferase [Aestuariibacter sp. AA17]|uniref:GNAT family N-acetyltransferase n=1 Tax=Fluctibacter corallii TaxID=2984329 RepID=A0ABT3AAB3_9ALTE|nr:GNAT family N-acetyltransferase [Aestuariibacter sp. AA17]MCV2885568.1 GNAT family N-acetyltransferase [Aestuariibacter sp. AA17]
MQIRTALPSDQGAIVAFNQAMAEETEGKRLDENTLSQGVAKVLNDQSKGFYLVAEVDGNIAGSLMVTYEWSDWRNGTFYWIQSVYVMPEFRRKGIYKALYEQVKTLAEENADVCGYRLYVEKDNLVAQQTYVSLGMQESYYLMYEAKS